MPPIFTELARAKINLTLDVLGRRPDGYHELRSLVAFADVGDVVTLDPQSPPRFAPGGRFAPAIVGRNLVERALELLRETEPRLRLGAVSLEKELPVASGIGGGSADAAALLRAVRVANPSFAATIDWPGLAARLGADVAVCLENRAAWMEGIGERVTHLVAPLPPVAIVLANALAPVPHDKTAQVFRRLAAPALPASGAPSETPRNAKFSDAADVARLIARHQNALEAPARAVMPEIGAVMDALSSLPGSLVCRLTGAGPTCFALFAERAEAENAAALLAARYPGWWIKAASLS